MKPRSPVRRKVVAPASSSRAWNVVALIAGLRQYFADAVRGRRLAALGRDDGHAQHADRRAAAHELPRAGRVRGQRNDGVARERVAIECAHRGAASGPGAGDHQRRLSQAVAGIEGRRPESARREGLGEARERGRQHGLGADEGDGPRGQVEPGALLRRDLAHAQVVREVRAAGDRRAGPADGVEPEKRILDEHRRCNDDVRNAEVRRGEDAADQAHVVARRKPEHALRFGSEPESAADGARVGHEIRVAQHHPLGAAGGAGRVLDHRQRVGFRIVLDPALGVGVGNVVGGDPAGQCGPDPLRLHGGHGGGGAQHHERAGVARERVEAIERSCPGRIRRDGDAARVERPEERGDEFDAGRVRKHDVASGEPHVLQAGSDAARLPVELGIRADRLGRVALGEMRERGVAGALRGVSAKRLHDAGATVRCVRSSARGKADQRRRLAAAQRDVPRTRPRRIDDCAIERGDAGNGDERALARPRARVDERVHAVVGEFRPGPNGCRRRVIVLPEVVSSGDRTHALLGE
jgi:hypothetical protein